MKLSIIIPVYNVREYLEECLKSVESQTIEDYEVVVVNDGSTDGSAEFIDKYCLGKPFFRVIHKKNEGLMSAWVEGVKASQGEYLGFVDSDDSIAPDMYERLYDLAINNKADIVMCDFLDKRNGNSIESLIEEGFYNEDVFNKIRQFVFPVPGTPIISNSRLNKLFRRELITQNIGYCECKSRTFEDRYIVPAAIFSAKTFYYTKTPYYHLTTRAGSNSGKYRPDLLEEIKRMYFVQEKMLRDKGLFDCYKLEWEKVLMNYIRVYVLRNIIGRSFKIRKESAVVLINDELVLHRMNDYGKLMKDKMGKALRLSFALHSPTVLVLTSYLAK